MRTLFFVFLGALFFASTGCDKRSRIEHGPYRLVSAVVVSVTDGGADSMSPGLFHYPCGGCVPIGGGAYMGPEVADKPYSVTFRIPDGTVTLEGSALYERFKTRVGTRALVTYRARYLERYRERTRHNPERLFSCEFAGFEYVDAYPEAMHP